jgi:hypothetical protein
MPRDEIEVLAPPGAIKPRIWLYTEDLAAPWFP